MLHIKKVVKSIVKISIILSIFYFLGKGLYLNWSQIDFKQLHFNVFLFIVSVFFLLGFFLMFTFGWKSIFKGIGVSLSFFKGLKIIFYSQLGKYLPGKIWTWAGRIYFCQQLGIPASKTFLSIVLELALTTISGILIFLVAFSISPGFKINIHPLFLIIVGIISFTIIHPRILTRIINFFLYLIKKEPIKIDLNFSQICFIMGCYLIVWFCFGIAFYFLINSVTFIAPSKIPIITGSFAISNTIGVMALFAPAGLGVREGVLSLLLSNFFPLSLAILLSFLCRIWISVGELIIVGISTRIKL
ncbi:MAG: lysylphosphatidylglycerol synthase domain-containing protein [bacterium]